MAAPSIQLYDLDLFDSHTDFNILKLFYAYYKVPPCQKKIKNLELRKLLNWIDGGGLPVLWKFDSTVRYNHKDADNKSEYCYFVLENEMIVDLSQELAILLYKPEHEKEAEKVVQLILKFLSPNANLGKIHLVVEGRFSMETLRVSLNKPKLSLNKHYNADLKPLHKKIVSALKKKGKGGVVLFHGKPGTGKSTYIRHLIHLLGKKVIFVPSRMAANMDTPTFTSLLVENKNAVFVIEDAEELLVSREQNKNSGISMLLNITDGLLGESLGIQVIATFNTHLHNIDQALLRRGRLIALYEFKHLCIERSNILLNDLKMDIIPATQPMTLAEIYNAKEEALEFKKEQQIGFVRAV